MYKIRKTIPCPFCESGNVDALYFPSRREREATRGSGQGGSTLVRIPEKYQVLSDCPNCGKKADEIQRSLSQGNQNKPIKHQELLERLKKAGLPTRI